MSVHPEFAAAILDGSKRVEFRKRPIASDVTHVAIYVTHPVRSVVGLFAVADQVTTTPDDLWRRFRSVAGISRRRFFDYYADRRQGTGIRVDCVLPYPEGLGLDDAFGLSRPPQSFQYLADDQADRALELATAS